MENKKLGMASVGLVVAAIAFLTLFLELLIARFFMFYFGHVGSLFAIPYALIGMALGGLTQRLLGGSRFSFGFYLRRFAESSTLSLILLFALGNSVLPPTDDFGLMLEKTAIFGTLFLIPFFLGGFVLSKIFADFRHSIGRLYFADLASGALACFGVPVLFHFFDAQPIILVFVGIAFLAAAAVEFRRSPLPLAALILIITLAALGFLFAEKPDFNQLWAVNNGKVPAVEIKKKWNEHSRLSLLAFFDPAKKITTGYRIVQDDAVSNVYLKGYRPGYRVKPDMLKLRESLPWTLGMEVKNLLVLFAGCGKDMIVFDSLSQGALDVTGVELNPAVKEFCLGTPELRPLRLKELYEKPNMHLVIAEGRNFLEQNRDKKYDVVYVAASGSPIANLKQSSSRKYLETAEAYRQYESHLRPGGVIIFGHQVGLYRLDTLKMIHADGSDRPFSQSIIVGDSFIAYKPDGFAKAELRAPLEIQKKDHKVFKYLPRSSRNSAKIAKLVDSPVQDQNVMTDDRPFAYPIEWAYLAPASWGGKTTARNWRALDNRSRVVPVVFLLLLVAFAFAIHRRIEKRDHRLKTKHIAYFVVTGFAYMCVEMGLIGKYDLFLGNPLYSMALISAVFLFSNGMGSLSVGWVRKRFPLYAVAGAALLATLFTLVTADLIIPRLIGLELAAKIPIVVLLIMPIGFVLGMFFPYAVSQNEDDPTFNVSSAYGFSVLSSVLGGTYSLAVMMNLGYRSLLLHSAVCYSLMAVVIFLYRRSLKSKVT